MHQNLTVPLLSEFEFLGVIDQAQFEHLTGYFWGRDTCVCKKNLKNRSTLKNFGSEYLLNIWWDTLSNTCVLPWLNCLCLSRVRVHHLLNKVLLNFVLLYLWVLTNEQFSHVSLWYIVLEHWTHTSLVCIILFQTMSICLLLNYYLFLFESNMYYWI